MITTIWWALQLGGLIPTTWFLLRFRPARPVRHLSLTILGLVAATWVAYANRAIVIAIRGGEYTYQGAADLGVNFALTFLVDAFLWVLLIKFIQYRRDIRNGTQSDTTPEEDLR